MGFIQYNIFPAASVLEENAVIWTYHKVLQHGIVCDKNMGRVVLHLLAAYKLVGIWLAAVVEHSIFSQRLSISFSGLSCIAAVCYFGIIFEQGAQTFDLVVGKGIHRVNKQCPYSGFFFACLQLGYYMCQHGNKKALCFTGACTRGNNHVFSGNSLGYRLFLMQIQWPGKVHVQLFKALGKDPAFYQLVDGTTLFEGVCYIEIGPVGKLRIIIQKLLELLLIHRILQLKYSFEILLIFLCDFCGGRYREKCHCMSPISIRSV